MRKRGLSLCVAALLTVGLLGGCGSSVPDDYATNEGYETAKTSQTASTGAGMSNTTDEDRTTGDT